jgi:hypothetical protein
MERGMKILKKESSTPASSHWTLSSKRVNNRWRLDKEEMMREGIQTEFKYVQFTTTKLVMKKVHFLAPKGIGSRCTTVFATHTRYTVKKRRNI